VTNEDPDRPPKHLWRSDDEEEDGEDPLIALGHMVKLAGIGIWRKVASRDKKTRPVMQERSNSDSVLEIGRPVAYADDEDVAVVSEPTADTSDDKPSVPQMQIETAASTAEDEVDVVQTHPVSAVPIPTTEP